jgi:sugar/nucleoside kinase (ribokinase family)
MPKIYLVGQALMDHLCVPDKKLFEKYGVQQAKKNILPSNEITSMLQEATVIYSDVGGCVTNTTIGLSKLERECEMFYALGHDTQANDFTERMQMYPGITLSPQWVKGHTGRVVTFDERDKSGNMTCVYNHGVSNQIRLEGSLESPEKDSLVYISTFSFFNKDSSNLYGILQHLKQGGSKIITDLGGLPYLGPEKARRILEISDGLFANRIENAYLRDTFSLSGEEISTGRWYIEKNGGDVTNVYSGGKKVGKVAPMSANVANTLGAGDAFAAKFLDALCGDVDIVRATKEANEYARTIVEKQEFH